MYYYEISIEKVTKALEDFESNIRAIKQQDEEDLEKERIIGIERDNIIAKA